MYLYMYGLFRVWKAADYTNNSNIKIYSLFFCNFTNNGASLSTLIQETVGNLNYPKSYGVQSSVDISNSEMIIKNGEKCPLNESISLSARVKLVCGKYLGDLEFVKESNCVAYFEFSSNELCGKHVYKNQIPCYLINKYGYKIDMLLLQNSSGPHLAFNSENEQLVFNVCADLQNTDCPVGASACYNKSNVGSISESTMLKLNDEENIELFYKNELNNCSTTIIFICPYTADSISYGPEFTKEIYEKCSFKIRWYTEFACSLKYQIVKNSCVLKTREFTFDLSPLNKSPWIIEQKGKDNYTISLSVCQPKVQCNGLVSVCQDNGIIQKVLGKTQTSLRYVDKKLYYIFKDGEKCKSWINRTTFIVLICDLSASDLGVGKPVFQYEDNCTYFIEWYTLFACPISRNVSSECRAINKDQVYDLTPLKKPLNISNVDGDIFQISVCGLLNICEESSICNLNKNRSLGKFSSDLQILSNNSLLLNYAGGEKCNNLTHSTKILFICSPGNFLSTPNLSSVDHCHHLVTWETAYACPLIQKNGNQCSINDSRLGIDIDLSYLKPLNGDFFNITNDNFTFQMKICSGSKTTSCNENGNLNTSVTGCYISNTLNTTVVSSYQGSELLNYFAGMLDITYSTGQKCSNGDNYIMKISFICNLNISTGNPVFEQEVEHCFYHFTWITKFACIPLVQCTAFSDDGKAFELSILQKMDFYEVKNDTSSNQTGKFMLNICKGVIGTKCSPLSGACYESDEMTMNLGFLKNRPQLLPSGDVEIVYENGDFCDSKNQSSTQAYQSSTQANQSSTVIKIVCNKSAEKPIIKLVSIKNCKYEFRFETTATCQNNNLIPSPTATSITTNISVNALTAVTTSATDTTPTMFTTSTTVTIPTTDTTSTTVTIPTTNTTSTTVITSTTTTTTTTASVTEKLATSRTGKIPSILAVTIVVAILFIGCCWILYSPEKREMLTNTINSIMGRKTRVVSRYKYTKLSAITSDDDSDEINEVFSIKNESSDEEMLPL
ncbi:cation-independent mannose-6-phosphate receptor isoform X3 [Hydra vulgaris]|uniref:Cation-independent mannose-6-phosphate receptor isoform X3 n=1 Tax=Hydra vulgaris TaxID=6087 RepID=A0ABM4DAZ0_HYDVU